MALPLPQRCLHLDSSPQSLLEAPVALVAVGPLRTTSILTVRSWCSFRYLFVRTYNL